LNLVRLENEVRPLTTALMVRRFGC